MIYTHVLNRAGAGVSAVPPTPSEAAPPLLAGELGCSFRPLTSTGVAGSFPAQRLARAQVASSKFDIPARELGYGFRSLCSPHSVP